MRLPLRLSLTSALAPLVATGLLAGCVTRTVYVVDDAERRPAPSPAAPSAAAPAPVDNGAPDIAEAEPPVAAPPAPRAPAPAEPVIEEEDAPQNVAAVDEFYEPLSSYGSWVDYPSYGRVWVPSRDVVGAGFRPYTYGHWEYSEYGWTWVDHSPFGWATGHYGRWFYDGVYGWVWVPGTAWAPAWVAWRTGGAYAGWAPLPPGAEYGSPYTIYDTSWVFVPYGAMGVAYVGTAIIVGPGYHTCFVETYPAYDTVVYYGNTYYAGPDTVVVEHNGGHVVHRPAHEIDHDHPTSHPPPSSHVRTRPASTSNARQRGTSSSIARPEASRGRGDERGSANDNHPSGRDAPPRHDRGGRDDGDAAPASSGRPERPERVGAPDGMRDLDPNAPGRAVEVQPRPIEPVRPEASRPEPSRPDVTHPARPDVTRPSRPDLSRPDAARPVERPDLTRPVDRGDVVRPVDRGDVVRPDVTRPVERPDLSRPVERPAQPQPIDARPDVVRPDVVRPDVSRPDVVRPDVVRPDVRPDDVRPVPQPDRSTPMFRPTAPSAPTAPPAPGQPSASAPSTSSSQPAQPSSSSKKSSSKKSDSKGSSSSSSKKRS